MASWAAGCWAAGPTQRSWSGFGDVAAPGHGVTVVHGIVDNGHELIERQVVAEAPAPVVFHLDGKLGIERMVREGGNVHIVVRVDTQGITVAFRRVGDTVLHEGLGNLAQISVEDAVETLGPYGGELAVRILHDGLHIALEDGVEFALGGEFGTVVHAGVVLLRHDTVVADDLQHVTEAGTLRHVQETVEADILERPVVIGMTDDEHFGQVRIGFRLEVLRLDDFGLEEGDGGEAPAGAAVGLVLHRGDRNLLDGGELVVRCLDGRGGRAGLGGGGQCEEGRCEENESFFHINAM